jgi:hypothetical protein
LKWKLIWGSFRHKEGHHREGQQTEKRRMKGLYQKNTMGRYIQAIISRDDFLEQVGDWLGTLDDERMVMLRKFIFEVDLSETEELTETLYQYGSFLTEKNYIGRKFFSQMSMLLRQMERNRRIASKL